ncbi:MULTISPECIES: aspartate kinase [Aerococcus]|uniref:aspartate kinase n=1 Tax=Aerococcus TaxID=1375 RepID=UPI0018A755FC|nr:MULTISPECIES: aspartate kinase [Aerococcus]MCY3035768.1 aspartate kinase [Aerococcus sp. Group 2]MCY3040209.1 aspartate kinase [Aerococcus sp. Group 2]MCY3040436.1 aspartate kinase [Aerococcus sp. Group 2]MCY3043602.1 aspartate kinase [Aerococcus sp. Group 2]MDK6519880.1 aspartate kinase [Aerococcus urinae]
MKVVKFGGSSLANDKQIKKVKNIIASDKDRKIIIVSAPGKRFDGDIKVTDLLIELASQTLNGSVDTSQTYKEIVERYRDMAEALEIQEPVIDEIKKSLNDILNMDKSQPEYFIDALKASGEDNNAKLIAAYFRTCGLNASYINPGEAGLILSDEPGNAKVLAESYLNLAKLKERDEILVFPGFFGYTKEGKLVTFSRGGSDITGAIVANGVGASMYENFTDVDSIFVASPAHVPNPVGISNLTYREMRELSYAGFTVVHDEALYPAFAENIPVVVKNTNNPEAPGTMITEKKMTENKWPIAGIASHGGFASVYITKYMMNREVGFMRRVLSVFEEYDCSVEHVVSGIDDIDVIFKEEQLSAKELDELLLAIQTRTAADKVEKRENLCLLMIVGESMQSSIGITARATKALSQANINLEMINQGSSENSVMFGIKENKEAEAVRAIYDEFFDAED